MAQLASVTLRVFNGGDNKSQCVRRRLYTSQITLKMVTVFIFSPSNHSRGYNQSWVMRQTLILLFFYLLLPVSHLRFLNTPTFPANHSRHQVYVLGTIFAIWCDSIRLGTKQFTEDCRNSYIMQWASPPLFAGVPATHPVLLQAGKPRCFEAAYNLEHRLHFVKSLWINA